MENEIKEYINLSVGVGLDINISYENALDIIKCDLKQTKVDISKYKIMFDSLNESKLLVSVKIKIKTRVFIDTLRNKLLLNIKKLELIQIDLDSAIEYNKAISTLKTLLNVDITNSIKELENEFAKISLDSKKIVAKFIQSDDLNEYEKNFIASNPLLKQYGLLKKINKLEKVLLKIDVISLNSEKKQLEYLQEFYLSEIRNKEEFLKLSNDKIIEKKILELEQTENSIFFDNNNEITNTSIRYNFFILDESENEDIVKNNISINKNNKNTYFYIVKGRNHNHWYLVIQEQDDVMILDSMGMGVSFNIYNKTIKDINETLRYHLSEEKIQYSSEVCEMYSIKIAIYLLRTRIFSDIDNTYNSMLSVLTIGDREEYNKNHTQFQLKKNEFCINIPPVLMHGFSEKAFGKSNDLKTPYLLKKRIGQIGIQQGFLLDLKPLYCTYGNVDFRETLMIELEKDILILELVGTKYQINNKELGEIIKTEFGKIKVLNNLLSPENSVKNEDDFKKFKIKNNIISKFTLKEFDELKNILDKNIDDSHTENDKYDEIKAVIRKSETMCDILKEKGKVDFENPYTSIKCGYMYRIAINAIVCANAIKQKQEI